MSSRTENGINSSYQMLVWEINYSSANDFFVETLDSMLKEKGIEKRELSSCRTGFSRFLHLKEDICL